MKYLQRALLLAAIAVTAACAHPMVLRPYVSKIVAVPKAEQIPKNVGLYISAADRALEVTTPGGGGDKVSYYPYADLEAGIYAVLGGTFHDVTMLQSPTDADAISKHALAYIVEPQITTKSSSTGVLTWMATDFTVAITCKITDTAGRSAGIVSSVGTGHADFSELKSDFSLAGERASQDALAKLQAALLQSSDLKK